MTYSAEYKRTTNGRAKTLISNAKARSKKKNVEVHIESHWVEEQLKKGVCELTGIPFSFEPPPDGLTRRPNAPSLDRKDKTKHYTEDNTRVVLWAVNCALAEYGTEIMLPILERTVDAIKRQSTSVPTQHTGESQDNSQLGTIHGAGVGQDCDGAHHHRGESEGQDSSDSTEAGCRICMGTGVQKMATLATFYSDQDNGNTLCSAEEFAKRIRCLCYQP